MDGDTRTQLRLIESAIEKHINGLYGTAIEATVTGRNYFTVSGSKADVEKVVAAYKPSRLISIETEYDAELDMSFAWFEVGE